MLASGAGFGLYHQNADRYKQALAIDGVTVEEKLTNGAADNLRLLLDPASGIDVVFMQGGIASADAATRVEMLASLHYEPLWVFDRDTRAFVEPLLEFNAVQQENSHLLPLGGEVAVRALQPGDIDALLLVGRAAVPAIVALLRDPATRVMNFARADVTVAPVDLPVSDGAERHKKFGPSVMHRLLPFWIATFVERFVIWCCRCSSSWFRSSFIFPFFSVGGSDRVSIEGTASWHCWNAA